MAKARFVLNRKGVREELLLSAGGPDVEGALVDIANRVKPTGADIEVDRSYGSSGRVVVRIGFDAGDEAARLALQGALMRIGGKFASFGD